MSSYAILVFLLWTAIKSIQTDEPRVTTKLGVVVGKDEGYFISYKGIPYAKPPIGPLRFANPVKFDEKWSKPLKTTNFSNFCAQYAHFLNGYTGDEDCLYLNVYVSKKKSRATNLMPVIFFIHGDCFMYGSGAIFGPEFMMNDDIVLVTFNYRLGVLGFLSSEDHVLPGNLGMKDQVMAMQWVKDNIEAFGGDYEGVTLSGYSSGGASVHLHYLSRMSGELFKNGISHSGTALNPWVIQPPGAARKKMGKLAQKMNCKFDKTVVECLRTKKAEDLVMFAKDLQGYLYNPMAPFSVVVENGNPDEDKFLEEHPRARLKRNWAKDAPLILTMTTHEGLYPAAEFFTDKNLKNIDKDWDVICPYLIYISDLPLRAQEKIKICKKVRDRYFFSAPINKKTFKELVKMMTARLYHAGAFQALQLHNSSVHYIQFDMITHNYLFVGPWWHDLSPGAVRSSEEVPPPDLTDYVTGATHGDDVFLIYYFKYSRGPNSDPFTGEENKTSIKLIEMYKNFNRKSKAIYSANEIPEALPPYENDLKECSLKCFKIAGPIETEVVDITQSYADINFWDSLYLPEYY